MKGFLLTYSCVVALAVLLISTSMVEASSPPSSNAWWDRFKSAFSSGQQTECVFRTKDHVYDFSKLRKESGHYSGQEGAYKYEMNVCGIASSNPMCRLHYSSICQFSSYNNRFMASLGSWTGNPKPQWGFVNSNDASQGVQLTYRNGGRCSIGAIQMPRVTNVQFVCADNDSETFTVRNNEPTCTTTIRLPTTIACGAGGSGGFFSSIFGFLKRIMFFTILFGAIYVAAGCFYNVQYNGKQWGQLDAVPNYEFWTTVPGHVKTGVDWTVEKAKSLMKRDGEQGYEQIKPNEDGSYNPSKKVADDDDDGLSGL